MGPAACAARPHRFWIVRRPVGAADAGVSLGGIFGSARYSVPTRFIGAQVGLRTDDGRLLVVVTGSGEVVAGHGLVAPGVPGLLTTIGADDHAWQLQRRHATLR